MNIISNNSIEIRNSNLYINKETNKNQKNNNQFNISNTIQVPIVTSNMIQQKSDKEALNNNINMKTNILNKIETFSQEKNDYPSYFPQRIIKKRIPSYQNNSNNHVEKPLKKFPNRIIQKINKSMNCQNNIIYNNSVITINNILENNNQKENINFKNKKQNIFQEINNYSSNKNNHKQNNQFPSKNKSILRPLGTKSQSYSKIPLNDNFSQLTKRTNPLKETDSLMENILKTQPNLNQITSPKPIHHQKVFYSNGNINRFLEKKEEINQIPIQIGNYKCLENKLKNKGILNARPSNKQFYAIPNRKNNNTINSNITIKINNINNSYIFKDEEKENIQNNSEYKKTFERGGQFNNIQTTYIVMPKNSNSSKNSNSKSKLISKINRTIDYDNKKFLFPTKSVMHLQPTKYYQHY